MHEALHVCTLANCMSDLNVSCKRLLPGKKHSMWLQEIKIS